MLCTSTSSKIRCLSSSSVKPAYSLKQSLEVTLRAMLNPEVRESRDTEDTPVMNVFEMLLFVPSFIAA